MRFIPLVRFVSLSWLLAAMLLGNLCLAADAKNIEESLLVMKAKRSFLELEKSQSRDTVAKYEVAAQYAAAIRQKDDRAVAMCALSAGETKVAKTTLILVLCAKYFVDNGKLTSEDDYVQRALILLNELKFLSTPTEVLLKKALVPIEAALNHKMDYLRDIETCIVGRIKKTAYGTLDLSAEIAAIRASVGKPNADYCSIVIVTLNGPNVTASIEMRKRQCEANNEDAARAPNKRVREESESSALDAARSANAVRDVSNDVTQAARLCQSLLSDIDDYKSEIAKYANSVPPPSKDTAKSKITASGLGYTVIKDGSKEGKRPSASSTVLVNYVLLSDDGTVIVDSAKYGGDIEIPLSATMAGFSEGLMLMHEAERARLTVPPALGYKDAAEVPPGIDADQTIIYEVELKKVLTNPVAE